MHAVQFEFADSTLQITGFCRPSTMHRQLTNAMEFPMLYPWCINATCMPAASSLRTPRPSHARRRRQYGRYTLPPSTRTERFMCRDCYIADIELDWHVAAAWSYPAVKTREPWPRARQRNAAEDVTQAPNIEGAPE
jgi:hypothetical protein